MKKICICGHFSFKKELLNGQTIKTKIICSELEKEYGSDEVLKIDTAGSKIRQVISLAKLFGSLIACENIIILPAHNGVRIIAPFLQKFNRIFKRRLHYIVIGGWFPEYVECRENLSKCLKKFDYIYVYYRRSRKGSISSQKIGILIKWHYKLFRDAQNESIVGASFNTFRNIIFGTVKKKIYVKKECLKRNN